jgi:hypothetical protein
MKDHERNIEPHPTFHKREDERKDRHEDRHKDRREAGATLTDKTAAGRAGQRSAGPSTPYCAR